MESELISLYAGKNNFFYKECQINISSMIVFVTFLEKIDKVSYK